MSRFVKLTGMRERMTVWIRAEGITVLVDDPELPSGCRVETEFASIEVKESPEQILAALSEPPELEVSDEAVEAPTREYYRTPGYPSAGIRAAILATLRVMRGAS